MRLLKETLIYIGIIVAVLLIRSYIVTPVIVNGDSMNPTLTNDDLLILKKYDKKIDRFEVVVLELNEEKYIKRVIGLPGEHIAYKDNQLYINGKLISNFKLDKYTNDFELEQLGINVIPDNYYFVLGDNRTNSTDSRIFGVIPKDSILGTTNLRIYPFNKIGTF